MDIHLRLLRHARELAEQRHFGRAARALHLTQPALSRSIAQLERLVGTRLFERAPTGVEPTDAGLVLLDRAADLMSRATDLGREIEALKGLDGGELLIGAGSYPAEMGIGRAMAALAARHPAVRARIVVDNVATLIPSLRRRDLGLVVGDATLVAGDPEFTVTPLASRQGYFVCRAGHPLAAKATLRLADIVRYPLVAPSRLPARVLAPIAAATRDILPQRGLEPRSVPSIACESPGLMKVIVSGSDGIAVLPFAAVATEVDAGSLVVLPLVEPWLRGDFAIIRLARRTLPASADEFARLLIAIDAELAERAQPIARGRPRGGRPARRR